MTAGEHPPTDAEALLAARGAVIRGHFQLSSGRHADTFIEKFRILQWPDLTGELCRRIADRFRGRATVVVGPTTGGILLSFETARHLCTRSLIAERVEGHPTRRELRRGFDLGPQDQVLVVDDVLTTGGSIREVISAVTERGASVAGVGVLVDRTGGAAAGWFDTEFFACLTVDVASYEVGECPQCRAGTLLVVT